MIFRRSGPLSRRQAEDLVAGHDLSEDGALARLELLLATAAAPTSVAKTEGEYAALEAFRTSTPPDPPARAPRSQATIAGVFTSRMIAALIALGVASGGVAFAASTGHIPGSSWNPTPATSSTTTATSPGSPSTPTPPSSAVGTAEVPPSASAVPTPQTSGPGANDGRPATAANPSLAGLCNAYESGVASSKGKALSNPAFQALIGAAGGTANVDSYCASLGVTPKVKPNATPTSVPATTSPGPKKSPPGQTKVH